MAEFCFRPLSGHRQRSELAPVTAVALLTALLLFSNPGFAQQATPATQVGDTVTHPVTGVDSVVIELLGDRVLTDAGDVIFVHTMVGDVLEDPANPGNTATIASVNVNVDTGLVDQVTLDNGDTIVIASNVSQDLSAADNAAQGVPGNPGGPVPVDIPTGNTNVVVLKSRGSRGGDGRDGYGVKICLPFVGCKIIGRSPHDGGDGGTGPALVATIPASHGDIQTISVELSGIIVSSIGGNGGQGGDAFGNFDGRPGGDAGNGGLIDLTSNTDITTSGVRAHGIFAQSRSGFGGDGGSGFILGGGGSGGQASNGGSVFLTNNGNITTFGAGGIGMFGQSIGGAAGDGGDSWGLVGSGGSSRAGGNGGSVAITNNGGIITSGPAAHGILAQSIGGTGGDGGDAGGLVAFGGSGSAGGNGGSVAVTNNATAAIRTIGEASHGVLAQSIGGGGGNGGTSGGVVAFGGTGNAGGNASTVTVTNLMGSVISTEGDGSSGVLAQSIGGGGGDGATSGGLVALGGNGSAAGHGASVNVSSDAALQTLGTDAKGIFAQSIGGGGGSARSSGGLVSIGGGGSSGGNGGSVDVTNGGRIQTDGSGSDALFAQSIGGGGGNGGTSGGVVSIGGGGSSGGAGSTVAVTNSGLLSTLGERARGIFAQSVGGGGGTGGDSGGLVSIGGAGSVASNGAAVSVTNSGAISTQGNQASAVQAQSIGGGGGDGGTSGGAFFTLGGRGGGGGNAGTISVQNSQNLSSAGSDSNGIFAQSIGGGGGNGGTSLSVSAFAGVSIGGSGGSGGTGGAVNVSSSNFDVDVDGTTVSVAPLIQTDGDRAKGIFAQSVGGGGGNGGFAAQVSAGFVAGASAAVGGSAGGGGNSGTVSINGDSKIITQGEDADGILAQSIGGGGGNGGFSLSFAGSAGPGAGALSIGVGGSGGSGGASSDVVMNAGGTIRTAGALSEGLIAQSVGGGGGNGGYSVAAGLAVGGDGSGAVAVSVGGGGGGGGTAGNVNATYAGDIVTTGEQADGLIAQSIGGGGGNGGFNVAATVTGSGGASGAISVGVGGSGGDGGGGGPVTAQLTGNVTTAGGGSDAVVTQSIGGGGGNGGINVSGGIAASSGGAGAVAVGVGGSGGKGGDGADSGLTLTGDVATAGRDAGAVLVQSVGGGGGNGGLNVSSAIAGSTEGALGIAVGVGGFGGEGGDAGNATSVVSGNISTTGDGSDGLLTQSIAGGGGNGGLNVSAGIALSQMAGGVLAAGVGGFGGDGGNASAVSSDATGLVTTSGAESIGVAAQSIGGGGGNGGLNVSGAFNVALKGSGGAVGLGVGGFGGAGGDAGSVTLERSGDTLTSGAASHGVIAQSVGGGGGNGGLNVSGGIALTNGRTGFAAGLGVGGFGGGSGDSGAVTATIDGSVLATGLGSDVIEDNSAVIDPGFGLDPIEIIDIQRIRADGSHGILVQSVGGAGGTGGLNVSGGISLGVPGTTQSYGLTAGVGGFGGAGGTAGAVDLTVTGSGLVSGIGDNRSAIHAQSVGGSGGDGGLNVSGGIVMDGAIALGIGGFGGDSGRAGVVTVNATSALTAAGTGAAGLSAQSIGGGGGNGGINISGGIAGKTQGVTTSVVFGMGGFGGAANISDDVHVTQTGEITVEGSRADGIRAQSIGGGGGNGGLSVSASLVASQAFSFVGGIGGFGGSGADAGTVNVTSNGRISVDGRAEGTTMVQGAYGIVAQSIGGGGGNGGMNVSGTLALRGNPMAIGVGGFGSGGGNGNAVTVTRNAQSGNEILTFGDNAHGIIAQSIGGGGGNAGINLTGTVTIGQGSGSGGSSGRCKGFDPRLLASTCANWDKVIEQLSARNNEGKQSKVGTILVGVGGNGGEAGDASTTNVTHTGSITTTGNWSNGILAQSIGGGGGNAALNLGLSLARQGLGANIAVGGAPADGGDAEGVTVAHTGDITTAGDDSAAIHAQSIGGGGGNAAMSLATGLNSIGKLTIGIGREGGTGGRGRSVQVTSDGNLTTSGDRAVGILAQSVGNGGGKSGAHSFGASSGKDDKTASLSLSLGLKGGAGGTSGAVDVTTTGGRIETMGSESHAIHAQSIGGGGGIGGMALTPIIFSNTVGVGLGGKGGTGGVSGAVQVDNAAVLSTFGEGAHGIFAQSIGGGGGTGGVAAAGGLLSGKGAAVATVGGEGGVGSEANDVNIGNTGMIITRGDKAFGVNAQSIGGGGGAGGLVVNGILSAGDDPSTTISLAIGGKGGEGGVGKLVDVTNEGMIHTMGNEAVGIRAQSIGGGGGDGGMVINLNIATVEGGNQFGFGLGGKGDIGGKGGEVMVMNRVDAQGNGGEILTEGVSAHGIFAQSLGGGGGNGGSVISANFTTGTGNIQAGLNIGGGGGEGGQAGTVTVTNSSLIETRNAGAHGIFAQSIGGGGGNGGLSIGANAVISPNQDSSLKPLVNIGGSGGDGNDGGTVMVNNSGNILTAGEGAHGIVAESIGGGGGNGSVGLGVTSGGAASNALAMSGAIAAILGGNGGVGGLGGDVTVNHTGDITVLGARSEAIVAQSINGGGGNVVLDFGRITGSDGDNALILVAGSEQVTDSRSGTVIVNATGTVNLAGDNSAGHAVQAVGGGGGTAYLSVDLTDPAMIQDTPPNLSARFGGTDGSNNTGGEITSVHDGDIISAGMNSDGVSLQSIGGGGGRGNLTMIAPDAATGGIDIGLGSTAGIDETGGAIRHTRIGTVATFGTSAYGMLVQSIGGGGGSVNLRIESESALQTTALPRSRQAVQILPASTPTVSLGSIGGSGLDGGLIDATLNGDIMTAGTNATGMLLQSIGGGGGESRLTGAKSVSAILGGASGASGNGGDLSIVNNGTVRTQGDLAHGVFLQSIGGGGGAVFNDATVVDATFSADNLGDGGNINFTQIGDIATAGTAAYGIFAQSIGGGGGYVDTGVTGTAGGVGTGGDIALDLDGSVMATGTSATALYLQSDGSNGAGNISVVLRAGHAIVAGQTGTAVFFDGGTDNIFSNSGMIVSGDGTDNQASDFGTIMAAAGIGSFAFVGTSGNDHIMNSGKLIGNVDLGAGSNSISNQAGAVFETGAILNLGAAANLLRNEGTIVPGGIGQALVSDLSGSYEQSPGARALMELDFETGTLDALHATGTVQVDGTTELGLLNPHKVRPGDFEKILFSGAGGLIDTGLSLQTSPSVVITYDLLFPNTTDILLGYSVDFSPAGTGRNLGAIGDYIGRVQNAGSSPELADTVVALLFAPNLASYIDALTQLTPDFYAAQQGNALRSNQQFTRSLRGCESRDSAYHVSDQNSCIWLRFDDVDTDLDAQDNVPAMHYDSTRVSVGFQTVWSNWILGLGASFEDHKSDGFDGRWNADGQTNQIGLVAQRSISNTQVVATLSYGRVENLTKRLIDLTDLRGATSDRNFDLFGGTLNVYHTFRLGGFSFKPDLGFGATKLSGGQAKEIGASGGQNLELHSLSETRSWLEPALEVGWNHTFGGGMALRPYVRVGALHYLSSAKTRVFADLEGAPDGVEPMVVSSPLGDTNSIYEAGLDLVSKTGIGIQLRYERLDDDFFDNGNLSLKFSVPL